MDLDANRPGWGRSPRSILRRLGGMGLLAAAVATAAPAEPNPLSGQDHAVLDHLNAAIKWYRQVQTGSRWILQPTDTFYWNTQRDLADEAIQAAFASAKAEVLLIGGGASAGESAAGDPEQQRLAATAANDTRRLGELRDRAASLEKKIPSASGDDRDRLAAQEAAVQAEIDLVAELQDSLQQAESYFGGMGEETGAPSLSGQIASLERSLPEAFAGKSSGNAAAKTAAPLAAPAPSSGLIGQTAQLYALVSSRRSLSQLIDESAKLKTAAERLATPMRASLQGIVQHSQDADKAIAATADTDQLESVRAQFEASAANFKQLSSALLPLRQESILLTESDDNLREWQDSFDRQYDAIVRVLLVRVVTIAALLAILLLIAEIWRRATFRYVHDLRRRRQFLIVRRFATGVLMAVVVIMGFVSDFSSLATFAGFITAGIAVALQAIILSVAAYFFLIGRYGVRVGDRVTLSGVTGEVIDVGLVRVYMMELAGTGVDLHPTGRVVVFTNSALFQATPLFKQIPGTHYTWHEVFVPLAPDADQGFAEEKVLAAVNSVYAEYRPIFEQQHSNVERLIDLKLEVPKPAAQLRFNETGAELVVRYPVDLRRTAEIDDRVAKSILEAARHDPKLKPAFSGAPQIRSAVKV